MLEQISWTVG